VMVVELVLHFLCLVPLSWFLGLKVGGGLVGIWGSALIYVVLLTAVMVWKFRTGDWKTIRI
jgi:MATE family multidrug resistance protein